MRDHSNTLLAPGARPQEDRYLAAEVLEGFSQTPKTLSPIWLYDERGSQLFDQICELPEYYPTRTELAILREHIGEMAQLIGGNVRVIEPGSGTSQKTRLLLDRLHDVVAYLPVDIAREHLVEAAKELAVLYPHIEVSPVCADFTKGFNTSVRLPAARNLVFFPGSTIGNFVPSEARQLLSNMGEVIGNAGAILIGVDLRKDLSVLLPAYDDAQGVTAEFNRNTLRNLNATLGTEFVPERFTHRAIWNASQSRIEMHLISQCLQAVQIHDQVVVFEAGEALVTEYSHKYTVEGFAALAQQAGLAVQQVWLDEEKKFSVQLLKQAGRR